MDELAKRVARMQQREVRWSDAEVERGLTRLHARRARRRVAAIGGALLLAGIAVFVFYPRAKPALMVVQAQPPSLGTLPPPPVVAPPPAPAIAPPSPIALGDGSVVTPLDPGTRLETGEVSPDAVTIRLRSGSARFHVVHQPTRVFRVIAGDVSLVDLGTDFTVARDGEFSLVEVFSGSVRVEWRGGVAQMVAGERRQFPPVEVVDSPAPAPTPAPPVAHPAVRPKPVAPVVEASDIEGLLATADQARLHGEPAAAVAPLRRILAEHAGDPRAPLAAFTLGRVLLDELDDPAAAAAAFAHARALAPRGPLADDALAREVEAWARAGDLGLARARAKEYLDAYPDGSRVREVRQRAKLP